MRTAKSTRSIVAAAAALALAIGSMAAPAGAAAPDGKAIFLAQKCNLCHSVPTADITRTTKSEKMAGPDLVNVKEDGAFLTKFLKKQADLNGKKHAKAFTGSDEELAALIAWIQKQKK
jgi:mono/diheme cytochrome c family protein